MLKEYHDAGRATPSDRAPPGLDPANAADPCERSEGQCADDRQETFDARIGENPEELLCAVRREHPVPHPVGELDVLFNVAGPSRLALLVSESVARTGGMNPPAKISAATNPVVSIAPIRLGACRIHRFPTSRKYKREATRAETP